jgi:hypothetical protein
MVPRREASTRFPDKGKPPETAGRKTTGLHPAWRFGEWQRGYRREAGLVTTRIALRIAMRAIGSTPIALPVGSSRDRRRAEFGDVSC